MSVKAGKMVMMVVWIDELDRYFCIYNNIQEMRSKFLDVSQKTISFLVNGI